ncbi:hypothetical protein EMIT0P228_130034 [Pseudomonas brassicacearum]
MLPTQQALAWRRSIYVLCLHWVYCKN